MIGRRTESATLDRLFESGRAELVAIYGRRRVGKTYLVDETLPVGSHSGMPVFHQRIRVKPEC